MDIKFTLVAVAVVILAVLGVFLFLRYKKLEKKNELDKDTGSELAGIVGVPHEEFKAEGLEKQEVKPDAKAPDIISTSKVDPQVAVKPEEETKDIESSARDANQEKDDLKLKEDGRLESKPEIPEKKEETSEAILQDLAPGTDTKDELKLEDELPVEVPVEKPIKKETKETKEKRIRRKKSAKKESEVIEKKEPKKRTVRRKKAPVQEGKTE